MDHKIITISRQYGSGGRIIGKKLADELGIPFYDNELINLAAEKTGLSKECFKEAESVSTGNLLLSLTTLTPTVDSYGLPLNEKIFLVQSQVIKEVAEQGSCVIVPQTGMFGDEKLPAKARVTIHYRISGHGREGQWKSEPMRNMFQGIFVKEFLLFYGEKVRYRLTVEEGDSSRDTEEKWLSMEEYSRDGGSKYQLLNQMLAGWTLSQNAMLEDGVKKYLTRERLAETMFPLIQ